MLTGFITYLEDYLDEAGAVGLLKATLGILAFAGVHALVESEDLPFFRLRVGANWKQPDKYRRRVHVTAWETDTDGDDTRWRRTQN